jgi:hypothetical protein
MYFSYSSPHSLSALFFTVALALALTWLLKYRHDHAWRDLDFFRLQNQKTAFLNKYYASI